MRNTSRLITALSLAGLANWGVERASAAPLPAVAGAPAFAQGAARELRIGHQKGYLSLLKGRGTLEQRLAPLKVSVKWPFRSLSSVALAGTSGRVAPSWSKRTVTP